MLPATDAHLGPHVTMTGTGLREGPGKGGAGRPQASVSQPGPAQGGSFWAAPSEVSQRPAISIHGQSLPSAHPLCAWNKPAFFRGGMAMKPSGCRLPASQWLLGPEGFACTLRVVPKKRRKSHFLGGGLGSRGWGSSLSSPSWRAGGLPVAAVEVLVARGCQLLPPAPFCGWGCQACDRKGDPYQRSERPKKLLEVPVLPGHLYAEPWGSYWRLRRWFRHGL